MSITTFLSTTAPVLSATLFSEKSSVILAGCLYASLIVITALVIWITTMGCECDCDCNPCQDDSLFDEEDSRCCCCCCVDCVEMLKKTCCALMCRLVCLKIYSCCCKCSPNFTRTLENSIRDIELRLEDGYESNEEKIIIQSESSFDFDFLGPASNGDNENNELVDSDTPILIKTGKLD